MNVKTRIKYKSNENLTFLKDSFKSYVYIMEKGRELGVFYWDYKKKKWDYERYK